MIFRMSGNKKKILHIINGMGSGGAEKVIMNWYRNIDRTIYQFDFLIRSNQTFYKEEIKDKGGAVYQVAPFPQKAIKNFWETYCFLKNNRHEYDAIHVHANSLVYIFPLLIAKALGIKKRIIHIHSTKAGGRVAGFIHRINRMIIRFIATDLVACSQKAGRFAFGDYDFWEIKNGIDLLEYKSYRDNNKNGGEYIIGHVGRFLPVKNHKFIIDIFYHLYSENHQYKLILIGIGPLFHKIKEYVKKKGLERGVLFLGERDDVNRLLGKMDLICFPSKYEGVPLVVLESQAAGVKVLMSDTITSDVIISPLVQVESLKSSEDVWCAHIKKMLSENIYFDIEKGFKENSLDIQSTVLKLTEVYAGE